MADKASLDDLVEGLAGAVVEAQRRIETHQIENFLSFFDEDRRPKKIDVLVPSMNPEAGGKDVRYRVPILPLIASSLLRIKEVEISFDTELVGVQAPSDETAKSEDEPQLDAENLSPKHLKSVSLDLRGAGVFRKKAASAHIVLKIEGRDISEGMARLVDRLIQIQGDIETVGND
jgi:hypothetical protein